MGMMQAAKSRRPMGIIVKNMSCMFVHGDHIYYILKKWRKMNAIFNHDQAGLFQIDKAAGVCTC